jgi:cytochrome c
VHKDQSIVIEACKIGSFLPIRLIRLTFWRSVVKKVFLLAFLGLFILALASPINAEARKNPCNPCAKNPCAKAGGDTKPIRKAKAKDFQSLVKKGKALWNDENLGKSGMSCMTCHEDYASLNLDKKGAMHWPHEVKMPGDILTLDQMINFCMINPMQTKQLDPNSIEMTAMAAYYFEYAKSHMKMKGKKHQKGMMNPCSPRNPCAKGMKNPCSRK